MTLFEFEDYREYLKFYISSLPKNGRGELTRIANHLAVNTTLISQIMGGTRDFNLEQALELSSYLGHTKLEKDYFVQLVHLERAGSADLKEYVLERIEALKAEAAKLSKRISHEKKLTDSQKNVFYSEWLYSAIHLYCSTENKGVTLSGVANRFQLTKNRAAEILAFLVSAGLVVEEQGRYTMGVKSTFVAKGSPHLSQHISNWRLQAIGKNGAANKKDLIYSAQFSLSKKDYDPIREKLTKMLNEVNEVVIPSDAEDIACLNLDWFWILD